MAHKQSAEERFHDRYEIITESGCWIWTAGLKGGNYGAMSVDGKPETMHRLSYKLHNGEIPKGMCVCHRCDIRECVNPNHLFLGTYKDNMDDMVSKGRNKTRRGQSSNFAKLTWEDVEKIRAEHSTGEITKPQLASKYGVTLNQIYKIIKNIDWVAQNKEL